MLKYLLICALLCMATVNANVIQVNDDGTYTVDPSGCKQ